MYLSNENIVSLCVDICGKKEKEHEKEKQWKEEEEEDDEEEEEIGEPDE